MLKCLQLINERTGQVLGESVRLADSFWPRLRGLLGRSPLADGEGLWLVPCRQVHMYGMAFPLSVWFLDGKQQILAIEDDLHPGTKSKYIREARSVLEWPVSWAERNQVRLGDRIVVARQW